MHSHKFTYLEEYFSRNSLILNTVQTEIINTPTDYLVFVSILIKIPHPWKTLAPILMDIAYLPMKTISKTIYIIIRHEKVEQLGFP